MDLAPVSVGKIYPVSLNRGLTRMDSVEKSAWLVDKSP